MNRQARQKVKEIMDQRNQKKRGGKGEGDGENQRFPTEVVKAQISTTRKGEGNAKGKGA